MAYTKAQVDAALSAAARRWRFRHEVIAPTGLVKPTTVDVASAVVRNNDLATNVKRTGTFVLAPTTGMDFFRDRLRSYAALAMPDGGWQEWAVGTFHLTKTPTRYNDNAQGQITAEGSDSLLVLLEDCVLERYVVPEGANVRSAVLTVLAVVGMDGSQISASAEVLPAAKEWEPGTPRLRIVNELLDAIGFNTLTMDPYGRPTSQPYLDPNNAGVDATYRVDASSVILPDVNVDLDLFNVPNAWLAVVSEPDREPLVASYVNDDPASRLSTVNRGRTIVRVLTNDATTDSGDTVEAVTQDVLDAKVMRAAAEATQLYETAEFSTGLMPFHGSGDVAILDYGAGPLRYREHEWEMALVAGGQMRHKYRRVVVL